jgi:hypothetical protein
MAVRDSKPVRYNPRVLPVVLYYYITHTLSLFSLSLSEFQYQSKLLTGPNWTAVTGS